jgi:uncharacterized protein
MPPEADFREFPGTGPGAALVPPATTDTAPFHEGLQEGVLRLQRCAGCGRLRHPVTPVCPWCTAVEFAWEEVGGGATCFSWVRYRRPFHPAFAQLVPYVVVLAELEAGPRLFGRLRGEAEPRAGMALTLAVERWEDGTATIAFEPAADG